MQLVLVLSAILTGNSFMLFTRWQLIKKTKEGPAPELRALVAFWVRRFRRFGRFGRFRR